MNDTLEMNDGDIAKDEAALRLLMSRAAGDLKVDEYDLAASAVAGSTAAEGRHPRSPRGVVNAVVACAAAAALVAAGSVLWSSGGDDARPLVVGSAHSTGAGGASSEPSGSSAGPVFWQTDTGATRLPDPSSGFSVVHAEQFDAPALPMLVAIDPESDGSRFLAVGLSSAEGAELGEPTRTDTASGTDVRQYPPRPTAVGDVSVVVVHSQRGGWLTVAASTGEQDNAWSLAGALAGSVGGVADTPRQVASALATTTLPDGLSIGVDAEHATAILTWAAVQRQTSLIVQADDGRDYSVAINPSNGWSPRAGMIIWSVVAVLDATTPIVPAADGRGFFRADDRQMLWVWADDGTRIAISNPAPGSSSGPRTVEDLQAVLGSLRSVSDAELIARLAQGGVELSQAVEAPPTTTGP